MFALIITIPVLIAFGAFSVWTLIQVMTGIGTSMDDALTSPEFEAELHRSFSSVLLVEFLDAMLQGWQQFREMWDASSA